MSKEDGGEEDVDFNQWNRAEIVNELSELDDSNERINAVADLFLMQNRDDDVHAQELCILWMNSLRSSDTHDRIPFLYVANHVIFKSVKSQIKSFQKAFLPHLPQAVSLVCNSPADRETVLKILRLWHEQTLYSLGDMITMWKETGEPLPSTWKENDDEIETEKPTESTELEPDLPMGLKARAAHPIVDCLKQIDHAKRIVLYLDEQLQTQHRNILQMANGKYFTTAAEIQAKESPIHLRDKVEIAMQALRIRNKYMKKLLALQTSLREVATIQLEEEKAGLEKIEAKFEQCDSIDIGLADLSEHRRTYPQEWIAEEENARERKRLREIEMKKIEEERNRRQKEAKVENAKIVSLLEEDVVQERNGNDIQTSLLQKMAEEKDPTKEYVWHPVLRELVPLQSVNAQSEDWRDH